MIGFFPEIYPDELLYSAIARYYERSGYTSVKMVIEDIYQSTLVRPDVDFVNKYTDDAFNWITKHKNWEDIIVDYTMYPAYRFLNKSRRDVFHSKINDTDINIGYFLQDRLSYSYKNKYGTLKKMEQIYDDYCKQYQGMYVMPVHKLQELFTGKYTDLYCICQLALFENVSVQELINAEEPSADEEFFKKIANQYDLDISKVKMICSDLKEYYALKRLSKPRANRTKAWQELDETTYPEVVKLVEKAYDPEQIPKKLSYAYVEKSLRLAPGSIYKLEKCNEYIKEHLEDQEHFWIRKLMWGIRYLENHKRDITLHSLHAITHIRYETIRSVYRFIKDDDIREKIEKII